MRQPAVQPLPKMHTDNNPTSKFCEECGSALAPSTEFASPSLPQARSTAAVIRAMREQSATDLVEGERKAVTDLLEGIRVDRADGGSRPEEVRAIIDPALMPIIDPVHRYDGR